MDEMLKQQLKEEVVQFRQKAEQFMRGEISIKEFKGFSGGFGSYAQRGRTHLMLRLRMDQGVMSKEKLAFVCDSCRRHDVDLAHITTCQTIQLHHLSVEAVCDIMEKALDVGIVTRGGGGDYPRNVMCSPLSGVERGEYFDVRPYAEAAGAYLISVMNKRRMPRKLKVAFSSSPANATHATFRDLGFVARADGAFDVYCCGGLGNNPKMGVRVASAIAPSRVLYYVEAMIRLFIAYGDYTNRARARTRYLQDTLGENLKSEFDLKLVEAMALDLDIDVSPQTVNKQGKAGSFDDPRVIPQKQDGLYAVSYHPIGGELSPASLYRIEELIRDIDACEVRIGPDETMYIINLTADEVPAVLKGTDDGARTAFEHSVSCVGASICQVGLRDSNGALQQLVRALRPYGFADGVLPRIHISGCTSSCGTHQSAQIGLQGTVKLVDQKPQPAYVLSAGGCDQQGRETFGKVIGTILESDLIAFFTKLGTTISAAQETYEAWIRDHGEEFAALAAEYTR